MKQGAQISPVLALCTAVAALGGLLLGFDTAVIAGTTHALTVYFHLTALTLGITVSCALWGTIAACLFASISADRFGSRESLRIVGILYIVSAVGCAFTANWHVFLFFRFIGGIAIGGCSVFAPMYIAEAAPAAVRGKLVSCFQLSIVSGILVAYASNYLVGRLHLGVIEWRVELGVAAFPALFFFAALGFIPRSPRWLVKKGRIEEAQRSLQTLGLPDSIREVERIQASLSPAYVGDMLSIFSRTARRPLCIALALGFFNQFSGINAILYYLNDIFAQAGFGHVSSGEQAVAVGLANLVFTFVGMSLIDRLGRKPLLLAGASGMAAALGGVSAIFFTNTGQRLLLPLLVVFIACFAASQGTVVWVYLSEIFPNALRDSGQSLASFWLWLLTAVIAGIFPSVAAFSSGGAFMFFSAAMLTQFFVVLRFFPETKGRALESTLV